MNLPNQKKFSLELFGRELSFTVSDVAGQANAAVIGQYGDTSVLVTAVMGKEDRQIDYFPLSVDYEERFYAVGKVLGSRFVRREGRPSDLAILSGRLVDRSIRPLFDHRLRRDVQVAVTILSFDEENDPDFLALITASVALSISDIPWNGPVAGVRVLKENGGFVWNPTYAQIEQEFGQDHAFEAFFAGTKDRINMIELGGSDGQEEDVKKAFAEAQENIQNLVAFQESIVKEIGKEKTTVALIEQNPKLVETVRSFMYDRLSQVLYLPAADQQEAMCSLKEELFAHLESAGFEEVGEAENIIEELTNEIVHKNVLEHDKRPDGRKLNEIRPLWGTVGLFKRLHGSALFSRGKTQSLAVTTLAAPGSEQLVETMELSTKRRFMLHYNFPPYSTGETGRFGSPGRREIGHGALAEKALRSMIPSQDVFPYTIRVVSEILSSNGSSSMASVCAGTLSLMDAGVPMKKPVAGIAMGLVTHQGYDPQSTSKEFKVLTDIQGPEDHYGDMDLKVAGTKDGITAMQMDVKVEGITPEVFDEALARAKEARSSILSVLEEVISEPRKEISSYAPVILATQVRPDQIGMVIGGGGKVINGMIEDFGLISIDINDDGKVFVSADSTEKAQKAIAMIEGITKEYEVGELVHGTVDKILDFGVIVDLGGGKDGMVHVSEMSSGYVKSPAEVFKVGDEVDAKVISVENGRIGLSTKEFVNYTSPRPEGSGAPHQGGPRNHRRS